MAYINNGGIYSLEDRYAKLFVKSYNELTPMQQTIITKTLLEGDYRLYNEYLIIVAELASKLSEEDEELGMMVYRRMLPNVIINSKDDIDKLYGEIKIQGK